LKPFSSAHPLVKTVVFLLLFEVLALAWIFFALLLELLSGNVINVFAEIFLIVLAAGAAAWVLFFIRGILNKKRWARSAAFFWQLLQGVTGAGAVAEQGINQLVGILLVLLSGAVVLLLFNKTVVFETNEENEN
jgi:hypothetical protein